MSTEASIIPGNNKRKKIGDVVRCKIQCLGTPQHAKFSTELPMISLEDGSS